MLNTEVLTDRRENRVTKTEVLLRAAAKRANIPFHQSINTCTAVLELASEKVPTQTKIRKGHELKNSHCFYIGSIIVGESKATLQPVEKVTCNRSAGAF